MAKTYEDFIAALADAKKLAHTWAARDGCVWHVYVSDVGRADFGVYSEFAKKPKWYKKNPVYSARPTGAATLTLEMSEAKFIEKLLSDERDREAFAEVTSDPLLVIDNLYNKCRKALASDA